MARYFIAFSKLFKKSGLIRPLMAVKYFSSSVRMLPRPPPPVPPKSCERRPVSSPKEPESAPEPEPELEPEPDEVLCDEAAVTVWVTAEGFGRMDERMLGGELLFPVAVFAVAAGADAESADAVAAAADTDGGSADPVAAATDAAVGAGSLELAAAGTKGALAADAVAAGEEAASEEPSAAEALEATAAGLAPVTVAVANTAVIAVEIRMLDF